MKLTKHQLNKLIENYINEGEFGKVAPDESQLELAKFEMCDFSPFQSMYSDLLSAISARDVAKYEDLLKKEQQKSNNSDEINRLQQQIDDAKKPGFFENIINNPLFITIFKFLGGAFSILSIKSRYECDMAVERYELYIVGILAPLLKLDPERVKSDFEARKKEFEAKRSKAKGSEVENKDDTSKKTKTKSNAGLAFLAISKALSENGITNFKAREAIEYVILDSKLSSWHFDLFELIASEEYNKFVQDPTSKISYTALNKFVNAHDELRNEGRSSFKDWNDTFVTLTPGIASDSKIKRILKSAKLNEYFDEPDQLTNFIKVCFNQIVKNSTLKFHQVPKREKIRAPSSDSDKNSED